MTCPEERRSTHQPASQAFLMMMSIAGVPVFGRLASGLASRLACGTPRPAEPSERARRAWLGRRPRRSLRCPGETEEGCRETHAHRHNLLQTPAFPRTPDGLNVVGDTCRPEQVAGQSLRRLIALPSLPSVRVRSGSRLPLRIPVRTCDDGLLVLLRSGPLGSLPCMHAALSRVFLVFRFDFVSDTDEAFALRLPRSLFRFLRGFPQLHPASASPTSPAAASPPIVFPILPILPFHGRPFAKFRGATHADDAPRGSPRSPCPGGQARAGLDALGASVNGS